MNGAQSLIVPDGGTIKLTARPASQGSCARPRALAYLLSGFQYRADTLAMTFGKVPGMKADLSKTAKAISLAFAGKDCLTAMDELARNEVSGVQRSASCLVSRHRRGRQYGDQGAITAPSRLVPTVMVAPFVPSGRITDTVSSPLGT